MEKTLIFYKNEFNNWYADIPEYIEAGGNLGDLQMVCGADSLLDIMSGGENRIKIKFSTKPFDNSETISLIEERKDIGGGDYLLSSYDGVEFSLQLWLCEVTRYVMKEIPKNIYFKRIGNEK